VDPTHRLSCILSDVARTVGIEPTAKAFYAHSRSLERWNDRQWNAVGSDDVYFYSVAAELFAPNFDRRDLVRAAEKARVCGMKSVSKRLGRVVSHYAAVA